MSDTQYEDGVSDVAAYP